MEVDRLDARSGRLRRTFGSQPTRARATRSSTDGAEPRLARRPRRRDSDLGELEGRWRRRRSAPPPRSPWYPTMRHERLVVVVVHSTRKSSWESAKCLIAPRNRRYRDLGLGARRPARARRGPRRGIGRMATVEGLRAMGVRSSSGSAIGHWRSRGWLARGKARRARSEAPPRRRPSSPGCHHDRCSCGRSYHLLVQADLDHSGWYTQLSGGNQTAPWWLPGQHAGDDVDQDAEADQRPREGQEPGVFGESREVQLGPEDDEEQWHEEPSAIPRTCLDRRLGPPIAAT